MVTICDELLKECESLKAAGAVAGAGAGAGADHKIGDEHATDHGTHEHEHEHLSTADDGAGVTGDDAPAADDGTAAADPDS